MRAGVSSQTPDGEQDQASRRYLRTTRDVAGVNAGDARDSATERTRPNYRGKSSAGW
jgi:hypothetical protein